MSGDEITRTNGPLSNLRVLDLSRVLAGPWATQLLADYGADCIKVEKPGTGDDTRRWGPPWIGAPEAPEAADSAYFQSTNRNKRSITVNLGHARGQEIVRELALQSDVVVENFRVGTMQRYGLGYEALAQRNPRLIFCSISAYGQTGSRAGAPGYDAMIQASAGLMSITGSPDEEGGRPEKVGVAIADIMTGMYAATAILAALAARGVDGNGQYIDLSLYDSQVAWLANQNMNYLLGGEIPGRQGSAHPNIVPYQVFATADGHLMLATGTDAQFRTCAELLGLAELGRDSRFATNAGRVRHRAELVGQLAAAFRTRDTDFWIEALTAKGVPAGPINNIGDVFSEPYAKERQFVHWLNHPLAGSVPTVANPVRFSATPVEYRCASPTLGQHTHEILRDELQLSAEQIAALYSEGAI